MDTSVIPVDHLSPSAINAFITNQAYFKKRYILQIYEDEVAPAQLIGQAFHKTAQFFFEGLPYQKAVEKGIDHIELTPLSKIAFNTKHKSIEDIVKGFSKVAQFFANEQPKVGEILGTEVQCISPFEVEMNGKKFQAPVPLKGYMDMVTREEDGLHIWDWKVTSKFSDKQQINIAYAIQAVAYKHLAEAKFEQEVRGMDFVEIKQTQNRDNSPQIEVYHMDFSETKLVDLFNLYYMETIRAMTDPDHIYLPNPFDFMHGEEAIEDFLLERYDLFQPTQVERKKVYQINEDITRYQDSEATSAEADNLSEIEVVKVKLQEFGIYADPVDTHVGATVTMHTFTPKRGIKMSDFRKYADDIALATGAKSVRVLAPIAGTKTVGVEISNDNNRKAVQYSSRTSTTTGLEIPIGVDVFHNEYVVDLAEAPHMLVAGATGTGKSVFLNSLIETILNQTQPEEAELALIDPKQTELVFWEDEKHVVGVYTEEGEIKRFLSNICQLMDSRYKKLKQSGVRNIDQFNESSADRMSRLIIVFDEFGDIVTSETREKLLDPSTGKYTKGDKYSDVIVKDLIRLAQKARAAGIHLVMATQRPSVDVIKGTLKANLPVRVAFTTSSNMDSQVILDEGGAEKLTGKGDLLLKDPRARGLVRLQGYLC